MYVDVPIIPAFFCAYIACGIPWRYGLGLGEDEDSTY